MKASIIITNFNYSKYLARCLRSCFNQSLERDLYEIILVDDCSSDDSIEVANSFKLEKNFLISKYINEAIITNQITILKIISESFI